jgi:hypothetical protein
MELVTILIEPESLQVLSHLFGPPQHLSNTALLRRFIRDRPTLDSYRLVSASGHFVALSSFGNE